MITFQELLNSTSSKSAIGNSQPAMSWMADRPRLLPFVKRSNSDKFRATPSGLSGLASTGVAGHVFNTPSHATSEALTPPFSHFDPFGTEFREPGRVSHPLQRSFQLAPEFLASTRQSRLNSSYADVECDRYLFVRKTFNVAQHYCFSINAPQTTQRLS
jgi:hypothetical protein